MTDIDLCVRGRFTMLQLLFYYACSLSLTLPVYVYMIYTSNVYISYHTDSG